MAKKKWKDLTRAERRVQIAKDALKTVQSNTYRGYNGGYLAGFAPNKIMDHSFVPSPEDCDLIAQECSVCARGALLLSRASRFNTLTMADLGLDAWSLTLSASSEATTEGLSGAFTEKQLEEIENAFESDWANSWEPAAEKFGASFPDRQDRLIAILQNIIDHGTFKPTVEYEMV